jgi:hypothetical protein
MNEDYKNLDIYKCFKESKLHSTKSNIYFNIYDELFNKYRNKKITFVEIGVKWGGSLLMWKKFFGNDARIIGIDLYPETKKLEKHGLEIFIGDQSSDVFWKNFFSEVGNIDVLLDDGGHTNENQILTVNNVINNVNDNGLIVIEDTSVSYEKRYFNPSKHSFINYSKFLIDDLYGKNAENFNLEGVRKKNSLNDSIYSIKFFNSIVAFFIDRKKCLDKKTILNRDLEIDPSEVIKDNFENPRWSSDVYTTGFVNKFFVNLSRIFFFLKKIKILRTIVIKLKFKHRSIKSSNKLKKYFR